MTRVEGRSLQPRQRSDDELFASLHERLAGTHGVHELAELQDRYREAHAARLALHGRIAARLAAPVRGQT